MTFALKIDCTPKTHEELAARRHKRFVAPLLDAQKTTPRMFADVSLEAWLEKVKQSGVDFIPGETVCRIPVDVIMRFDNPEPEDRLHWSTLKRIADEVVPGEMLRWDCCASFDVKMTMSRKGCKADQSSISWQANLSPDDPRFFDICYEYPGAEMAVIRRPWVEARQEGTHPAEYRVFVRNSQIEGVANYYIQRDIPLTETVRKEVLDTLDAAQRIVDSLGDALPFNLGHAALHDHFSAGKIHCTMDFLVTPAGQILFLEAGPAFGLGAHPCAFMENIKKERVSVQGVALAVGKPPLSVEEFKRAPATRPAARRI